MFTPETESKNADVVWRRSSGSRTISTSLEADRYTWLCLLPPPQKEVFIPIDLSSTKPYTVHGAPGLCATLLSSGSFHPKSTKDMLILCPAEVFITHGALGRPQPLVSAWWLESVKPASFNCNWWGEAPQRRCVAWTENTHTLIFYDS